jgi:hypothetical protein
MLKQYLARIILLIALLGVFSCKEKIIEYRDIPTTGKPTDNDQFHGDVVGKITQNQSGAVVILSQVSPVDSVTINSNDGSFIFRGERAGNYDLTIRADNYRIYSRSNVIVTGGGIAYIGEIDLSKTPDLVASYYPADQAEIVYDNRYARLSVSLLFTRPMDRVSVEKAFSTYPPTTGIFHWGDYAQSPIYSLYYDGAMRPTNPGAVITTYSKITSVTYEFSRKSSLVDTTYVITLSTDAKDTSGNHLRFPLSFSFKTVQSASTVYGIQTNPIDGDIDVSLISDGISITFPRRMDPATTEAAFTITPNDAHFVLWPQGNIMKIFLGGVYRSDTTYTVTIDSTALDLDGNKLGERVSFSFTTASVQVSYTSPSNGEVFVANSGVYILMSFNTYIVKSTVENSFSISPAVSGYFVYGYPGNSYYSKNVISFVPTGSFTPNTLYKVTIGTNTKDLYDTPMNTAYTFSFVTRKE